MSKSVIKFWDKIIVVLLGIVGIFSACSKPVPKYGLPYGHYEVKGVITDKETSNSLQNIQVVLQRHGGRNDTIYTDIDGKYVFRESQTSNFHIKYEDIDGEENGGDFKIKEIKTKLTEADRVEKGDGNWYEGKFVKTVNVELEKK